MKLPTTLTVIGESAFEHAYVVEINLPEGLEELADSVLRHCRLESLVIPTTVKRIGVEALEGNPFKEIVIPASVERLESYSFANGSPVLETITFLGNAPYIAPDAFWDSTVATAYYPGENPIWTEDMFQDYGGREITWLPIGTEPGPGPGSQGRSGTCGDNLTWVLGEDGVLTISGTGPMYDYGYDEETEVYNAPPWDEYREDILSVIVEDGVATISACAFSSLLNLTDAYIGEGITALSTSTFNHCDSLTSVMLPNSLAEIYYAAFMDCTSLKQISIPENVTYIEYGAFIGCTSLEGIHLPAGVTSVGEGVFNGCSAMTWLTVDPENPNYTAQNNILYSKDMTEVICCPGGITGTVVLPDTVTHIGTDAFCSGQLSAIVLPEGLTYIGPMAFAGCMNLTEILIPANVDTVREYAFDYCLALPVTFTGSAPSIRHSVFGSVTAEVYYPGEDTSWTEEVRQNYAGTLTWIAVGGDTPGGEIIASGTCGESATWTLTDTGVLTVSGTGAIADYSYGDSPWLEYRDTIVSVGIEAGIEEIGAFGHCHNLVSVEIPDTVSVIKEYAFLDCRSLITISVPKAVTEIREGVFSGCTTLPAIVLPNNITSIGNYAFQNCAALPTVVLPEKITNLGDYAFQGCAAMTKIHIPASVLTIGTEALSPNGSMTELTVAPENPSYCAVDNILYSKDMTRLLLCPGGTTGTVIIPNTVIRIENNAFSCCYQITGVVIPDSVTSIGTDAFYHCSGLTEMVIPESVTSIEAYAFSGLYMLRTISLPTKMEHIGSGAFAGCQSLENITLPEGIDTIGECLFENCGSLSKIVIPEGVVEIKGCAFAYCSNLKELIIPASVTKLGNCIIEVSNIYRVTFRGHAPAFSTDTFFDGIVTAYYPFDDPTWTENVWQDYGGNITWIPDFGIDGQSNTSSYGEDTEIYYRVDRQIDTFTEVRVNGNVVDPKCYDVTEGSTVITFRQDYLDTLRPGEYDVIIAFTDGVALSTLIIEGPPYTPGDINGDSVVNNKDLTRLFQFLSGYDVEVTEAALDVNGDGNVNNKDLTRLFQYLSGYDVEIH